MALFAIVLVFGFIGWFLVAIFEGEKPKIQLGPVPVFLTKTAEVPLIVTDAERGIRTIKVTLKQGTRHITLLEKRFSFEGLFNAEGIHRFETVLSINPSEFNQGRADLEVYAWDYSRSSGGDGNLTIAEHKMTVDTIPPALRLVSQLNYVNTGGTGLIVYQTTSDSIKSGLFIKDYFFPGFPAAEKSMVRSMLSESLKAVISQTLMKKIGGGRVAAHEIMIGTPAIRNLIREDKIAQMYSAIQTGQNVGMQTLDQNLKELLAQGVVAKEEAKRKAAQPDSL